MAEKKTVDKVKSLLEGHCYGPLREAAEKWLAVADEKYDIKEKAGQAWDKLNEAAEKYAESSEKFTDKMNDVSDKIGDTYEKIAESELVAQLKDGICTVGDLLQTFGSKEAKDRFGEDFAEQMKKHAEALKEKGEKFCDCDACVKARSILKDFGEDIDEKYGDKLDEIKEKAAEKFEELKAKADEAMSDVKSSAEKAVEELAEDITEGKSDEE
jgi:colicin import membrane protein